MKKVKSMVVVSALALCSTSTPFAQGIPVHDGASIATDVKNQVENMAKWAQQFKQMQAQIKAVTGSRGMGDLLNNKLLNNVLPKDWKSLLSTIKQTADFAKERKKYPTIEGLPKLNGMYDVMASQNATMSKLYNSANERIKQIQSLMGQIDSAADPAAKMDLTNRLVSEQNMVQATQNLLNVLKSKQKQELEAASRAAEKEYVCKEFGKKSC